jgi:hypothetical protein
VFIEHISFSFTSTVSTILVGCKCFHFHHYW